MTCCGVVSKVLRNSSSVNSRPITISIHRCVTALTLPAFDKARETPIEWIEINEAQTIEEEGIGLERALTVSGFSRDYKLYESHPNCSGYVGFTRARTSASSHTAAGASGPVFSQSSTC